MAHRSCLAILEAALSARPIIQSPRTRLASPLRAEPAVVAVPLPGYGRLDLRALAPLVVARHAHLTRRVSVLMVGAMVRIIVVFVKRVCGCGCGDRVVVIIKKCPSKINFF